MDTKLITVYQKIVDEKAEFKKKARQLLKLYKKENEGLKARLDAKVKKIGHVKAERNDALKKLQSYRTHCMNLQQRVTDAEEEKNSSIIAFNKLQLELQLKDNIIRQQVETLNQFLEDRWLQQQGLDYGIKPQLLDNTHREVNSSSRILQIPKYHCINP
ncbi:hypothetical protein M3Y95_00666100 [Aphelenchoides besseyi]|nr:hypothetical protein M3Y95_00666100 [Aphelenchoides besseyi]